MTIEPETSERKPAAFPLGWCVAYLGLLALLVFPSFLLWWMPGFPVQQLDYDFFGGLLGWEGDKSEDPLLYAGQLIHALLMLVLGAVFVALFRRLPRNCQVGDRRKLVPMALISGVIALAGLPWMNPDLFFPLAKGWAEVHYQVDVYEVELGRLPGYETDPMFSNVDPALFANTGNYGPLNQLISALVAGASGGNPRVAAFVFKFLLLTAFWCSGWILWKLISGLGRDPLRPVFLYLCNPVCLFALVAWGHNDALQNLGVMLALLGLVAGRPFLAGAALGGAVGIKYVAFLLVPVFGLYWLTRPGPGKWRQAVVYTFGVVLVLVVGFASYPAALKSMVLRLDTSWSPMRSSLGFLHIGLEPILPGLTTDDLRIVFQALYGVFGLGLVLIPFWFRRKTGLSLPEVCTLCFWIYAGYFLLAAPAVLEWYLTWMLGFALLAGNLRYERFVLVLTAFFLVPVSLSIYRSGDLVVTMNVAHYLFYAILVVRLAWSLGRENFNRRREHG